MQRVLGHTDRWEETEGSSFNKNHEKISCREWAWNKITGYFRKSLLFKLSVIELWILRPHYLYPDLNSSSQADTHVLYSATKKSSVSFCSWIILRFLLLPSQPAASLTLSCLFWVPLQCVNKWSLFNSVSLWSVLVLRQWTFLFGSSSTLHQLNKRYTYWYTFCNCLSDPELNFLTELP